MNVINEGTIALFLLAVYILFLFFLFAADKTAGRMGFLICWWYYVVVIHGILVWLTISVVLCQVEVYHNLTTVRLTQQFDVVVGLIVDDLSVLMADIVVVITTIVQFFAFRYMRGTRSASQFVLKLQIFAFFMLLLAFSNNLIVSYGAWEGLGFMSFLLINFWSAREEANRAAVKAILFNRVADIGFVSAIALSLVILKSCDFSVLNAVAHEAMAMKMTIQLSFGQIYVVNLLAFCIFWAAIGKSAQLGFHVWLTAAMEGPTPVSALLHSATMVTAGVFLVLRCYDLFSACSVGFFYAIIAMGLLTCFSCGWFAFWALDLKRIVAYSTCSHLGLMFAMIGFNLVEVAQLHIHVHAFFKTTLFLCAGLMMVVLVHVQNVSKMGAFVHLAPIAYLLTVFSAISLMGFPHTAGSISKERLIYILFTNADLVWLNNIRLGATFLVLIMTMVYTVRVVLILGSSVTYNGDRRWLAYAVRENVGLWLAPLIACCSILVISQFIAVFFVIEEVALDPWKWGNSIYIYIHQYSEVVPLTVRYYVIGSILAIYCLYRVTFFVWYKKSTESWRKYIHDSYRGLKFSWSLFFPGLGRAFNMIIGFVFFALTNIEMAFAKLFYWIIKKVLDIAFQIHMNWERGFLEIVGPVGLVRLIKKLSSQIPRLQTGKIYDYLFDVFLYTSLLLACIAGVSHSFLTLQEATVLLIVGLGIFIV